MLLFPCGSFFRSLHFFVFFVTSILCLDFLSGTLLNFFETLTALMIQEPSSFCFDVLGRALVDPAFARNVADAYALCQEATYALSIGQGSRESVATYSAKLVETCGFNIGMLMPSIYQNYVTDPETGELRALDFADRPYMFALSTLATDHTVTLVTGRQAGKCTTGDAKIALIDGCITAESLFDQGLPVL